MEWLEQLFSIHSSVQTVVVISLIVAVGLGLGKVRIRGISLGIAFVFFYRYSCGTRGLDVDGRVLDYAETFGLALLFIPSTARGTELLRFAKARRNCVEPLGARRDCCRHSACPYARTCNGCEAARHGWNLCGATTNTPALGAANQALEHFGISGKSLALATAVTYPLGVVGVIFAMMFLRKFFVRPADLESKPLTEDNKTYIAELEIINPAIEGKTIERVVQMTHRKFIISRLWRDKEVIVPKADTVLKVNDKVMVVTTREDERAMELLFGKKVETDWNKDKIDWNAIDADVESRTLVVTRTALNGKVLGQLQLRNTYSVNVSRITRGDIKLLATDDLRLQYGDRVTVVGKHEAVNNVEQFFGNSVKTLNEPNIGSIFLGLVLGLALGTIPINIPGMDTPIRLGVAGGPIIMGILVGALGPKLHFISYTTRSASLMLRKLGLSIYLACLGLDAGKRILCHRGSPGGCNVGGVGFVDNSVARSDIGDCCAQNQTL